MVKYDSNIAQYVQDNIGHTHNNMKPTEGRYTPGKNRPENLDLDLID